MSRARPREASRARRNRPAAWLALAAAPWTWACEPAPKTAAAPGESFLWRDDASRGDLRALTLLPGVREIAGRIARDDPRRIESRALDTSFAERDVPGIWRISGTRSQPRVLTGELNLAMRGGGEEATLVWPTRIESAALTHLLFELPRISPGLRHDELRVSWRTAQTGFDPDRTTLAAYRHERDGWLLVPLATHPGWRGSIEALRIEFGSKGALGIASVRGLHAADFLRLPESTDSARGRVEIERMRRPVVEVPARSILRERITVERGDSFVTHAALHPDSAYLPTSATRFEITAGEAGSEDVELLETFTLPDPEARLERGWRPVSLDLSAWAGREVDLRLATTPAPAGAETAAPLWAQPRLQRARGPAAGPNLVLIVLDTLRPDHLEPYGYPLATSPAIARLAEQGVRFEHCIAHAPTTLPSHAALFTGIPTPRLPLHREVEARLPEAAETLAEIVRARGIATAAFAGGAYLDPFFGLAQGFDVYAYAKSQDRENYFDYSDIGPNTDLAVAWLERNRDRRFFLFFHSYEVHAPYDPRERYIGAMLGDGVPPPRGRIVAVGNSRARPLQPPLYAGWQRYIRFREPVSRLDELRRRQIVASYDSEIRESDDHVGRLLAELERLGLLDATVVAFTSDHGEAFLENGHIEHGHLTQNNLRVPLILRHPAQLPAGRVVRERVQHADVLPTLLDLLDVPVPDPVAGISLVEHAAGERPPPARPIVSSSETTGLRVVSPEGLEIVANVVAEHPLAGEVRFFDLRTDPGEREPLTPGPAARAALTRSLVQAFEALPGGHVSWSSERPARFRGRLALRGARTPLVEQLKVFPWAADELAFGPIGDAVRVETAPGTSWAIQVDAHRGTLRIEGELELADGTRLAVDESFELGDLPAGGGANERPLAAGGGTLRAHYTGARPPDAPEDGSLSSETRRQLEALGYVE